MNFGHLLVAEDADPPTTRSKQLGFLTSTVCSETGRLVLHQSAQAGVQGEKHN